VNGEVRLFGARPDDRAEARDLGAEHQALGGAVVQRAAVASTEVRGLAALQNDHDAGCEALGFLVADGVGKAVVAQPGVEGVGAAV